MAAWKPVSASLKNCPVLLESEEFSLVILASTDQLILHS
jgi:hypothetical protein